MTWITVPQQRVSLMKMPVRDMEKENFSFFPFWYVIKVVLETLQEALSLFKRIETEKEREKKERNKKRKGKLHSQLSL